MTIQNYELHNVQANKSYNILFFAEGSITMRLAILHDGRRKVLTPWQTGTTGLYTFDIIAPFDGVLVVEDKIGVANITNIIVEEV